MTRARHEINPELDLVLERVVDVPRELVWNAWTDPELLKKWFTPVPWETVECQIDLRPGGLFRTVMRSPDGEVHPPNTGCYLEVIENEKLVWTDALEHGFRPTGEPNGCTGSYFTAIVLMEPHEQGTKYTAIALHSNSEDRKKHEVRGFHDGWGTALEQLVALVKGL